VEPTVLTEVKDPEVQTADFWTGVLMLAVVALALTLGWMVGHAARKREMISARGNNPDRQAQNVQNPALQNHAPQNQVPAPAMATAPASGGELVVYQNGRVVFPQPSHPPKPPAETRPAQVQAAVSKNQVAVAGPVRIPREVAAQWITQRVEPEYPQAAREQRIQGAVDLDAVVGDDGIVEKFVAIRGDPELAAAASAAVRQWRFKPYQAGGQPMAFETHITVEFRLP
jgi:TonB family protein